MPYDARYRKWYRKLIALYPRGFRERAGEGMEQTFNDLLHERRAEGGNVTMLALGMYAEASVGIIAERMLVIFNNPMSSQHRAALIGFLFALPFFVMNFIVALRIEPVYSLLGSFPVIRNSPWLPLLLLLLLPIGAYIAARPMLQKNPEGKRRAYLLNIALVAVMLVGFALLFAGLGGDFYHCEVLKIPNCD